MRGFLAAIVCSFVLLGASGPPVGDTSETASAQAIARFTTEKRFLSPWVASVPDVASVPSPLDFFGRVSGAEGELTYSDQAYAYYRALARATRRVHVETLGRTEEGREIILVAIADEAGIAGLEGLKAATAALADPRTTDETRAAKIIEGARPFYYFNGAIHADETGSVEMLPELAYRLAVSETPMIQAIRSNVVVLLNPVSNPDGRDKVADWFYAYLKGRTDFATLPRQSPPYWSRYAYVDLNRDTHQQTHEATRAVHRMFHAYHPTVVHDLHEAIALLQTWNGTGPYNPNLDPIATTAWLTMSFHEVQTLTSMGMPGVWTWDFGEGFGQHFLDSVAMNHNSLGRGYETWGNTTAETVDRVLSRTDVSREWYRPVPPPTRFKWSLRDNVNYQQTAALAALDFTARNAGPMLWDFYRKGLNSYRKGRDEPPFAYVIPGDQGDKHRVAKMIGRLLAQRIEVSRSDAEIRLKEGVFPPGSFVVKLDQPYRNYAVDLLSPQAYPEDAQEEPYDDISWSLPVHDHLNAVPIADPAVKSLKVDPVLSEPAPAGEIRGTGPVFLLADTGQESLFAARYALAAFHLEVAEKPFEFQGVSYPAGSWILRGASGLAEAAAAAAKRWGLDFTRVGEVPEVPRHDAPALRIGVFVPWADTDASGWVRYALDQRDVPYTYLRDEDIRAGGLLSRVDIILYGHVDLELAEQIHGLPGAWGPMAFKKTAKTPHLGSPVESDDITGGLGWKGLRELQAFVEVGGLLVTMGSGSTLALEGGLVRGVRRSGGLAVPRVGEGGERRGVWTPGSHVRTTFTQPNHPIAYGYGPRTFVFRANFPTYDIPKRWLRMSYCTSCLDGPEDPSSVVMEWGDRDGLRFVVSGGARGESGLVGRPAIWDVPVGRGRIVAFNFNPLHRDLNHGDHRLVWNALLNGQAGR